MAEVVDIPHVSVNMAIVKYKAKEYFETVRSGCFLNDDDIEDYQIMDNGYYIPNTRAILSANIASRKLPFKSILIIEIIGLEKFISHTLIKKLTKSHTK